MVRPVIQKRYYAVHFLTPRGCGFKSVPRVFPDSLLSPGFPSFKFSGHPIPNPRRSAYQVPCECLRFPIPPPPLRPCTYFLLPRSRFKLVGAGGCRAVGGAWACVAGASES